MKTRKYHLLIKLLAQNISILQLIGYALASLTGMSIIMAGFCFYKDIQPLFSSNSDLFQKEWIVLNKKVSLFAAWGKNQVIFNLQEIEEIKQQPFVQAVSFFTPARFQVQAYIESSAQIPGLATDLFFESVPDRLINKPNQQWKWNE
jgi:hypothetical protein